MTIEAGTELGDYKILAFIDAGGMGEVYLGLDKKLGRQVAIKVLPEELAGHSDRLARFEREARLLASLNHTNIATLYSLEHQHDAHFLVMELVEGATLTERLRLAKLSLSEVLVIFVQVAAGLEAAHDRGIVHRDLKPTNIKITPDGKVKILDFGLAKALSIDVADPSVSPESLTHIREETQAGLILGTASYMSPEQARGKEVDRRTDIWAFGCCLFEALAGVVAFPGETLTDILVQVATRQPNWEDLPGDVPPAIRRLLRRCLEKDLDRRLRDVGDARIEIEDALRSPWEGEDDAPKTPASVPDWRKSLPWMATALLAAISAAIVYFSLSRPVAGGSASVLRTAVVLPPSHSRAVVGSDRAGFHPVISPDGRELVYVATVDDQRKLFLQRLDRDAPVAIAGSEGAMNPFFSPDGEWVGFFAGGKLKKVSLDGGAAVDLWETPNPRGGDWHRTGIVFPESSATGLTRVSSEGASSEVLTELHPGEQSHRWPHMLPNGEAVIYVSTSGRRDDDRIMVESLETGEQRFLVNGSYARYVPTGHLVYARGGELHAAPFDLDRLELTARSVPIQSGVLTPRETHSGHGAFAFSETGTLVYVAAEETRRQLVLVDVQGRREVLAAPTLAYEWVRFSPDGRTLALTTEEGQLRLFELEHERLTLLTSAFEDSSGATQTPAGAVAWSPDGSRLAFSAVRSGELPNIFVMSLDSARDVKPILEGPALRKLGDWTRDGRGVVYTEYQLAAAGNAFDIMEVQVGEGSELAPPRPVVAAPGRQVQPAISPDGRWIAYTLAPTDDESRPGVYARPEVYVRAYDGGGMGRQVSTDGGQEPAWAGNREVYYRNGDAMMAVAISTEPVLAARTPRVLFEGRYELAEITRPRFYDLSPNGDRLVMLRKESEPGPPQFRIVQNWFGELARLVPISEE